MTKNIKRISPGVSLLEILVVVAIFAVLGIITTRSVLLTLRGSKKSESIVRVKENVDFAVNIIARQLRNADQIVECPNLDPNTISYIDQDGGPSTFSCNSVGTGDGYIASGSARLTSTEIDVISCSFNCTSGSSANPVSVTVNVQAEDKNLTGVEGSQVTTSTQIYLRNY